MGREAEAVDEGADQLGGLHGEGVCEHLLLDRVLAVRVEKAQVALHLQPRFGVALVPRRGTHEVWHEPRVAARHGVCHHGRSHVGARVQQVRHHRQLAVAAREPERRELRVRVH